VKGDQIRLIGCSDLDWAGSAMDWKSTSGYCFNMGSGMISWYSRKQNSVALSFAEAEYMEASQASFEALWLRKILVDLSILELNPTII
jgi:hypothetical protein